MEQLPHYMKICYLSLHNSINEIAFDILRQQGDYILPCLKKAHTGYTPSLQEYIDNAWISISGPVMLVHAYFLINSPIANDASKCLKEYSNIIRCASMVLRLANDLGTSSIWKEMNKERTSNSSFSETFINIAFNLARMAQCMYQHGDGHGIGNCETKERVVSLLIQPIP
uniref:Terpene synthase metal-binding domain-containing protein n=1 Tax=Manihot esculenta TaxID=3983 RepID=A0A2C9UWT3_MANES